MNSSLNTYASLVKFLGEVLGSDYEIVLQDTNENTNQVVEIANGQISGREVGAPLTDLALQFIAEKTYLQYDYKSNYKGLSKQGIVVKSSTYFIKDSKKNLLGMLCINHDSSGLTRINKSLKEISKEIVRMNVTEETNISDENTEIVENISEALPDLIARCFSFQRNNNLNAFSTIDERISVIRELERKGVFSLKGAVKEIAKQLKTSEPTIYRYLGRIRREKKNDL